MPDPTPDARGTEAEPVAFGVRDEKHGGWWLYEHDPSEDDCFREGPVVPLFTRAQLDAAVSRAVREALGLAPPF